jgi:hypothetical protein
MDELAQAKQALQNARQNPDTPSEEIQQLNEYVRELETSAQPKGNVSVEGISNEQINRMYALPAALVGHPVGSTVKNIKAGMEKAAQTRRGIIPNIPTDVSGTPLSRTDKILYGNIEDGASAFAREQGQHIREQLAKAKAEKGQHIVTQLAEKGVPGVDPRWLAEHPDLVPTNTGILTPASSARAMEEPASLAGRLKAAPGKAIGETAQDLLEGIKYAGGKGWGPVLGHTLGAGGLGLDVIDTINRARSGDPVGAAISGAGAIGSGLSFVPGLGLVGMGVGTAAPIINYYRDEYKKGHTGKSAEEIAPNTNPMGNMYADGGLVCLADGGQPDPQSLPHNPTDTWDPAQQRWVPSGQVPQLAEGGQPPKSDANEGAAFIGYPHINKNRKIGSGTGFLDALVGAPPSRENVLNANDASYMAGYEKGEPYGLAAGMLPFAGMTKAVPAVNRLNMHFKDVTKRIPQLQESAQQLMSGAGSREAHEALVNMHKPVLPFDFVPKPATREEAVNALQKNQKELYGVPSKTLQAGHPVGLRLDIPAYSNHGVWVPTIHEQASGFGAGKAIGHESVASVLNPQFGMSEKAALSIAGGKPKGTIATIKGEWNPVEHEAAVANAQEYLNHPEWRQVGMDPERHGYFYDRATMEPITHAEEALQIGPLVLAKKPVYGKKEDFKFSEGGLAAIKKKKK